MMYAFQENKQNARADMRDMVAKFCPRFERALQQNKSSTYLVGEKLTYVDVLLAEALEAYEERIPGFLSRYPLLEGLHARVLALPQIQQYLASPLRYGKPDDAYVQSVAKVLRRALPAHMENPQQFVREHPNKSRL